MTNASTQPWRDLRGHPAAVTVERDGWRWRYEVRPLSGVWKQKGHTLTLWGAQRKAGTIVGAWLIRLAMGKLDRTVTVISFDREHHDG